MNKNHELDQKQMILALQKINSMLKNKVNHLNFENKHLKETNNSLQKQIAGNKNSNNFTKITKSNYSFLIFGSFMSIGLLISVQPSIIDNSIANEIFSKPDNDSVLKSNYVIENLRGDVIETHVNWKWAKDTPINVSILNTELLDDEKIDSVKNAISSIETITLDDSLLHKGPKGSKSLYHSGWQGALTQINNNTLYTPPTKFNIFESDISEGNIVILLDTVSNPDGYSGFTKNVVDKNEILKSFITIYDVDSLSTSELNTIVKHEFGHALGLAHSTDPQDLMYPVIETDYPVISGCNIDALESLYDGNVESEVVCKK